MDIFVQGNTYHIEKEPSEIPLHFYKRCQIVRMSITDYLRKQYAASVASGDSSKMHYVPEEMFQKMKRLSFYQANMHIHRVNYPADILEEIASLNV